MTSTDIPAGFLKSCMEHEAYPRKLVARLRYGDPILQLAEKRLDKQADSLNLFHPEKKTLVPFRTISKEGVVTNRRLLSEDELGKWLGDIYTPDSENHPRVFGANEDPSCRFVFLATNGATQPLNVTRKSLLRILSYFQVTPSFLDFLYVFGGKNGEDRELRFSRFCSESETSDPHPDLKIPALNRSGKRIQLCYNLKTINLKEDLAKTEDGSADQIWKIRQAAIHHQFDMEETTQLWILAEPRDAFRKVIGDQFHETINHREKIASFAQAFKTSLEVHLRCGRWANEEWRWYINYLEGMVGKLTRPVFFRGRAPVVWEAGLLGCVQEYEEKAVEALGALESNLEILTRLQCFYSTLTWDGISRSETRATKRIVKQFIARADELVSDLGSQISRIRVLEKNVADRKTILIQHLQGQVADRAEKAAQMMQDQAERSGLEAIAVRIITVIALFYLPATFVATIFSTDIVSYRGDSEKNGGDEKENGVELSKTALDRFFQVSIPLMFLTFVSAVAWYIYERRRIRRRMSEQKAKIGSDMV